MSDIRVSDIRNEEVEKRGEEYAAVTIRLRQNIGPLNPEIVTSLSYTVWQSSLTIGYCNEALFRGLPCSRRTRFVRQHQLRPGSLANFLRRGHFLVIDAAPISRNSTLLHKMCLLYQRPLHYNWPFTITTGTEQNDFCSKKGS